MSNENLPQVSAADFSSSAIKKAVMTKVVQSPLVLYPTALGIVSGLAMVMLGATEVLIGGAAAGVGIGIGGLFVNYFIRKDSIAQGHIKSMQKLMGNRRHAVIRLLKENLRTVGLAEGAEQIKKMQSKYDNLIAIIGQKLNPSEITYGRYVGIAEQVLLSGMDNLDRAAGALKSIQVIDQNDVSTRIAELESNGEPTPAQQQELVTLRQRLELYTKQTQKVDELLAQNEAAMTRLDFTAAAIADMRTVDGHASMDMESAMEELQKLIVKAEKYSA